MKLSINAVELASHLQALAKSMLEGTVPVDATAEDMRDTHQSVCSNERDNVARYIQEFLEANGVTAERREEIKGYAFSFDCSFALKDESSIIDKLKEVFGDEYEIVDARQITRGGYNGPLH